MSDILAEEKRFAETIPSLLKEYAKRLDQVRAEANEVLQELDKSRKGKD